MHAVRLPRTSSLRNAVGARRSGLRPSVAKHATDIRCMRRTVCVMMVDLGPSGTHASLEQTATTAAGERFIRLRRRHYRRHHLHRHFPPCLHRPHLLPICHRSLLIFLLLRSCLLPRPRAPLRRRIRRLLGSRQLPQIQLIGLQNSATLFGHQNLPPHRHRRHRHPLHHRQYHPHLHRHHPFHNYLLHLGWL